MSSSYALLGLALLYVCALFAVAWLTDRASDGRAKQRSPEWRAAVYAFSLGVYCSSWTFYGAVGSAAKSPWSHAPIYLGPILVYLFAWPVVRRVIALGARYRVTSIADYFGARFGKRQSLSILVTLVAAAAVLPYVALQFRALSQAWVVIADLPPDSASQVDDSGLIMAIILAVFTMLFGTRRMDGRERHGGMMAAVAVSSIVKLVAFFGVALLALAYLRQPGVAGVISWSSQSLRHVDISGDFLARTLISALAILCLPRQFHAMVVEAPGERHTIFARSLVPAYLLLFMLLAIPISAAGTHLQQLLPGAAVSADTFVQWLPAVLNKPWIALLAFVGGISAATAMVIVATVALAIMVTNELAVPVMIRSKAESGAALLSLGNRLRFIRQLTIVLILLSAWWVSRQLHSVVGLTDIGFLSFVAAAQLAPGLLLGLYWRRCQGRAVFAGLLAGALLWFYCMVLPVLLPEDSDLLLRGPWALGALRPQSLFGWAAGASLSYAVMVSLGSNLLLCVGLSLLLRPSTADTRQAAMFVGVAAQADDDRVDDFELSPIRAGQLRALLPPFLDASRVSQLWRSVEERYEQRLLLADRVPTFAVREAESALAGVIGAVSAAQVIKQLIDNRQVDFAEFASLVSDAGRQQTFNRELLEITVESMQQGVAVIDAELRLVAWNTRYEEIFAYPERLLYVGMPVARLFRFNAERGVMGTGGRDVTDEVEKRLEWLRRGAPHRFERRLPDGRVIDIHGVPIPRGGFVTTYTDISDYRDMLTELQESRQELEGRVESGTQSLAESNAKLRAENRLRADAENRLRDAVQSKSRFMSATSHDLLQPINAARLFAAALRAKLAVNDSALQTVNNIDRALSRAEQLIAELREIARLDSGTQTPRIAPFAADALLRELYVEFAPAAAQKSLTLRLHSSSLWLLTDRNLTYRAMQNLLANAIKYSRSGSVVLGARRRANGLELQVLDQGPGIAAADRSRIFAEFERIGGSGYQDEEGLGLGLAIVSRYAALLDLPLRLDSQPGRGSLFSLTVPLGEPLVGGESVNSTTPVTSGRLDGVRVLCIDNDQRVREALATMLSAEGCEVDIVAERRALRDSIGSFRPDLIVADYHLDDGDTGIAALGWALQATDGDLPCIIVSADDSQAVGDRAAEMGYRSLSKPVNPARLTALVYALTRDAIEARGADKLMSTASDAAPRAAR